MNTSALFSSKSNNWSTPQEFYDRLNKEFHFTLDPCADEHNHKCDKYFTIDQDGLSQSWAGESVFCNPPYGKEIAKWVCKCFTEVYQGKCHTAVMLIPSRTDTKWFHDYIYHKAEVRFIRGRLKFGGVKQSAPFPSMIVIYRGHSTRDEYRCRKQENL